MYVINAAYFGAQCIKIGPTLGYLEPQGRSKTSLTRPMKWSMWAEQQV